MKLFPSYETTFPCDCSLQEATERIAEAAACEANMLKIKSANYIAGTQKIVLHAKWDSWVYRNPVVPVATLEIKETERGSMVSVNFALRRYIKIFLIVFCAYAMLLGVTMIAICLFARVPPPWPVFLPFVAPLPAYVILCLSMRFCVRRTLEILHYSLTLEFAKRLPSVHLC